MPEAMKAVPATMKKFEQATAYLPPPPKPKKQPEPAAKRQRRLRRG